MARDSIMARPTNSVRVMVAEASGCCASEVRAEATERPSPSAGAMHPTQIVRPAVPIDVTATSVMLSMAGPPVGSWALLHVAGAGSGVDLGAGVGAGVGSRMRVAAAMYTAARMLKM